MSSEGLVGQACSTCVERSRRVVDRIRGQLQARRGDRGASLVEYALLVSLIALVCVSSLRFFQAQVTSKIVCSASQINSATTGQC